MPPCPFLTGLMQSCISQVACDDLVAGIIGTEIVRRDQSLGDRILGAIRTVESLVHVGDWNVVCRRRAVDVVVYLVQIRFKSTRDSLSACRKRSRDRRCP